MNDVTLHQSVAQLVNTVGEQTAIEVVKPAPAHLSAMQQATEPFLSNDTIRIDANKLSTLLAVVGESVHASSHANILLKKLLGFKLEGAIAHVVASLAETLGRISRYSTDLQRATLTTRMQPVSVLFQKIETHILALAAQHHHTVDLTITGAHTEIDLDILDSLYQPLILIAGNIFARANLDHTPGQSTIHIELHARQGASSVMIEVKDHAREVNREALFLQATQRGLVPANDALADDDVLQLVFEAGITDESHQSFTHIKSAVTKHRGMVHLASAPGNTRFLLRFPIELSIIPTMVVRTADTVFALPMVTVERIITLPDTLDSVNSTPVLRDQGRPLPVMSLAKVLGYQPREERLGIIIAASTPYVLTVEDIEGATDLIIKPFREVETIGVTGTARSSLGELVLVVGVVFLLDGCRSSRLSTAMR